MAQIRPITSESLEAKVRALLPSQQGFGEDLQAQNVIVPVIDLTAAAASTTPANLQTAVAFGSQTAFNAIGGTDTVANTPGFFRVFGVASMLSNGASNIALSFIMSDGLSNKTIWQMNDFATGGAVRNAHTVFDFVAFLAAGESIIANSTAGIASLTGSSRQIADVNGNLVNPSGYSPQ